MSGGAFLLKPYFSRVGGFFGHTNPNFKKKKKRIMLPQLFGVERSKNNTT